MDSQNHNQKPGTHKVSPTDLLSSAKVMADAAKSTLHHESNKVDKAKVADAAANLLSAASHHGKVEEKSYGKYVQKAETYLHKYNASHSSAHSTTTAGGSSGSSSHSSSHPATAGGSSGSSSHSEAGFGQYMKLAEGFLKKH